MPSDNKLNLPDYGEVEYSSILFGDLTNAEEKILEIDNKSKGQIFINFLLDKLLSPSDLDSNNISSLSDHDKKVVFPHLAEELGAKDEYDLLEAKPHGPDRVYKAYIEQNRKFAEEFTNLIEGSAKQVLEIQDSIIPILSSANKLRDTISHTLSDSFKDSVNMMGALNFKVISPQIPNSFTNNLKGLSKSIADNAISSDIYKLVENIASSQLYEPFYSAATRISQLDSHQIHSPNYSFPEILHDIEDLDLSSENAKMERLIASYDTLIHLETSLRTLIRQKLFDHYGKNWWKTGVPIDVRLGCEERKEENEDSYTPIYHHIEYGYIHDYQKIVIRKDNWKNIFKDIFSDHDSVITSFKWVADSRISIAHSRHLNEVQHLTFTAGAKWLQTRIGPALNDD